MEARDELSEFRRRLAEVIAWCAGRDGAADPKNSLRTPALQPPAFGDYRQPLEARQAIVDAVVEKRATLLRREGRYSEHPAEDLAGGRLLICAPDESVWDAVSQSESQGFFDDLDIPAWDTWLCFPRELISWVPPPLVPLAEAGIHVNPVECIRWAVDEDTAFTRQLRAAGLLG